MIILTIRHIDNIFNLNQYLFSQFGKKRSIFALVENNSSRIANKDITTVVSIKTLLLFINQAHCCFNQLRKANLQKLVTVAGIEIEVMLFLVRHSS